MEHRLLKVWGERQGCAFWGFALRLLSYSRCFCPTETPFQVRGFILIFFLEVEDATYFCVASESTGNSHLKQMCSFVAASAVKLILCFYWALFVSSLFRLA